HVGHKNISQRGVLPARSKNRKIFFAGRVHAGILGINLIGLLDETATDELVHIFVGEVTLLFFVCFLPQLQHLALDPAHGLFFRDAGVGDAVHSVIAQGHFFGVAQVAIIWHAFVMVVRDKIKNILFQVRS